MATRRASLLIAGLIAAVLLSFSVVYYQIKQPHFTGKTKSIAVLPFINLDGNSLNEYFSDGITDEITDQLQKVPGIHVIARGSNYRFKGSKKPIQEIAAQLHATAVVQGNISKTGNRVKIYAEVLDAGTGKVIWSQQFDREINEIFSLEEEIARLVADQLDSEPVNKNISAARMTKSLEAYDHYLNGRYYYYKRTDSSLRSAINYFEEAVKIDSLFSKAYAGLADCYSAQGYISYELPSVAFLKAEKAARKSLELDSSMAEPHTSLGYIKFYYYWDWAGAEEEFRKAIRLDPGYAPAYTAYGYYLTAMERFPEAKAAMDKAVELDPLTAQFITDKGFSLYYKGDYNMSVEVLQQALLINPKAPLAHLWLGRDYQEKKMYEKSISEYEASLKGFRQWPVAIAATGYVYALCGRKDLAAGLLDTLNRLSASHYVTPYGTALIYASMNDRDNAFRWLTRAFTERSNWMVWLKLDPRWAPLSDDKRYDNLVKMVGLEKKQNFRN